MPSEFPSPRAIKNFLPISPLAALTLSKTHRFIHDFFSSDPFVPYLLILGPCSIHHDLAAIEYAKKLRQLTTPLTDFFFPFMRVHIEKPRTKNSWKGFVYDPHLDQSDDIENGIVRSRKLMLNILELGLPISMEILDPFLFPFFDDLISFATIGARTVTSQPHRLLASSFSCPVGFKNRLDGDIESALFGIQTALESQTFLALNEEGRLEKIKTKGNRYPFLILRGGNEPNYDEQSIKQAKKAIDLIVPHTKILIDCAHGNRKRLSQKNVFERVIEELLDKKTPIAGLMLESYLDGGKFLGSNIESAPPSISITDPCLSFDETEEILLSAHSKLMSSNQRRCLNSAICSPSTVVKSAL